MARIRYSQEIKQQAVKLVLEDRQTMIETARQIGCTPASIQLWIKKVQQKSVPPKQLVLHEIAQSRNKQTFDRTCSIQNSHNGQN